MRSIRFPMGWFWFLLMVTGWVVPQPTHADEPRFVNPSPRLKPVPEAQAAALGKKKLGSLPKLTKEDLNKIAKGEVLIRKLSENGDKRRYEAIGSIDVPPKTVMAFMKDYPKKPNYFPHMEKISVTWNGNLATVDLRLKVAFKTISYRMRFLHLGDHYVDQEFIHGDIKDSSAFYKFFPYSQGRKTLMVYNVYSDPGLPLPDFILNLLTKNSLPGVFDAVRRGVADRIKSKP